MPANPATNKEQGYTRWKLIMDTMISACTEEKRVRALYGEIPHTLIHIIFIFFYGGSAFLYFGVVLSLVKVLSIPLLFTFAIEPNIESWTCSKTSAAKFLVSGGSQDKVYRMALRNHWYGLLNEFYDFEYPSGKYRGIADYGAHGWVYECTLDFTEVEWLDDLMTKVRFLTYYKVIKCPDSVKGAEGFLPYEVSEGTFDMKTRTMNFNGIHLGISETTPNCPYKVDQLLGHTRGATWILKDGVVTIQDSTKYTCHAVEE